MRVVFRTHNCILTHDHDGDDRCAGVISGALLYIRDDFKSVDKEIVLQVHIYIYKYKISLTC